MPDRLVCVVTMIVSFLLTGPVYAQHISFYYLGPENGMQALASSRCLIDAYGYFWITTLDGVVRYDGNKFNFYNTVTHPEIPTNDAGSLYRDSHNRIWFCSPKGLVLFDEKRQLRLLSVVPEEPDRPIDFAFENSDSSITVISKSQAYTSHGEWNIWEKEIWLDTVLKGNIRDIKQVSKDQQLIIMPSSGLLVIDTRLEKVLFFIPMPGLMTAESIDGRFLYAAAHDEFALFQIDLLKPDIATRLPIPDFVEAGDDAGEVQHMTKGSDGYLYMNTARNGLIQYNPKSSTYKHYNHDPVDPFSIMDNRLRYIYGDDKGNLLITGVTGINYTNIAGSNVQYFRSLHTMQGNIMDERVSSLHEDGNGWLWFTTDHGLYRMTIADRRTEEIHLPVSSALYTKTPFLTNVAYDGHGRMWVSYHSDGIAIYDQEGNHLRDLHEAQYPGYNVAMNQTRIMRLGVDGWMYIGTSAGLFRIDPITFAIDTFADDTALAPLRRDRIVDVFLMPDFMWVATSPAGAAWKYQFSTKALSVYDVAAGLRSSRVYTIGVDQQGIALVGTYAGLSMIYPDGTIKNMAKGSGLPGTRIENILRAADGTLWLANSYNLLFYDEQTQQLNTIVGEPHLSDVGFQIASAAALSSGEIAFGVHKGLIIIDPVIRHARKQNFDVNVFYKNTKGHEILCTPAVPLQLSYKEQVMRFDIGITNLMLANKMIYQYRIAKNGEGEWSEPSTLSQLNFNLRPGRYTLEVRAFNGSAWIDAPGPIAIRIQFPWWQRWWFIALALLGFITTVGYFLRARIAKYKRELSITRQIGELESRALRAQMNPHFVFNSLNAIQECIVTGKIEQAYTYLSKFSRLLRLVLEHSDMSDVLLQDEMEVLSLYVSLEKLRFADDMQFELKLDPDLDAEEIRIPPMLIQPHVENALWHGLAHMEGDKILTLEIAERMPGYLDIGIEDNGVGRLKSMELRQHRLGRKQHTSKGKQMSDDRIQLLKDMYPHTHMEIIDLADPDGQPTGTRVLLRIPIMRSVFFEKRTI